MSDKVLQQDESMIPEGVIYIRPYKSNQPWRDIGNNSAGTLTVATEERSLPNYRGGGGNRNTLAKISSVGAGFTIYDISAENVALALRGTQHDVETTAIVDELVPAAGVIDETLALEHLPDRSKAVTVKTADDTELVLDTDYAVTPHGLRVLSDKVTAAGLKVSYTPLPGNAVDLLVGQDIEWEVRLLGTDAAQGDKPFKLEIWKAKFQIAASLQIINDNYAELPVTLSILVDDTVDASGAGKFAKFSKAA